MSEEKQSVDNVVPAGEKKSLLGENIRAIFYAIVLALVIRTFLFQPFNIPSGSMLPTLFVGDYIFVSKYRYGFSKYSLPFSPDIFSGRIFSRDVKHGDVVVFKLPSDNATDYIKRVVGLPGDRIQVVNGRLILNGQALRREGRENFTFTKGGKAIEASRYREILPNGVAYEIIDMGHKEHADNTRLYHVPAGHYFVMGDNRDNSQDSRFRPVGYVPYENLVGKAQIKFYSFDKDKGSLFAIWEWPSAIRWSRILGAVR